MQRTNKMVAVCLMIAITLGLSSFAFAEEGKEEKYIGRIERIEKDKKEITVRENNVPRIVVYNDKTEFYHEGGKAAGVDAFALRDRVLASGKLDSEGRLVATQINLRTR